jgi:hypothetical protein
MRLVYRPGHPLANENGLVDINLAGDRDKASAPSVIRDETEPVRHMADGQYYTSKKKFRDATRAYGCIEVGNEIAAITKPRKPAVLDRRSRREAIRQAIHTLRNR